MMCRRGQGRGSAGVPELLFTLRVCAPHLQGLHLQGNQRAPLLERRDRITRKDSGLRVQELLLFIEGEAADKERGDQES